MALLLYITSMIIAACGVAAAFMIIAACMIVTAYVIAAAGVNFAVFVTSINACLLFVTILNNE